MLFKSSVVLRTPKLYSKVFIIKAFKMHYSLLSHTELFLFSTLKYLQQIDRCNNFSKCDVCTMLTRQYKILKLLTKWSDSVRRRNTKQKVKKTFYKDLFVYLREKDSDIIM